MGEFGWGEYPDLRTMAASLEAACSLVAELEVKVRELEAKIDNMQITNMIQPGAYSPRNRRFNV